MARSRSLAPIAILLAVLLFMTGCAGAPLRSHHHGEAELVAVDGSGAVQVHHSDGVLAALVAVACLLVIFTVVVDLIMLPYTIPHHHPFWCTQGIFVVIVR
jgi:uncharacterized protein YceK